MVNRWLTDEQRVNELAAIGNLSLALPQFISPSLTSALDAAGLARFAEPTRVGRP